MLEKIPGQLQKNIDRYFNLQIGNKKIVCPYFISNKIQRGNLRVMVGKGSADEIEHEVKVWAKVKGFNLKKASKEEIRKFMIDMHIGIDCSGLIANILDDFLKKTKQGNLLSKLKFQDNSFISRLRRWLRPIENIGANTLTSELNCDKVENLNSIMPGDLIRAKGPQKNAFHVAMITEVERSHTDSNRSEISGSQIGKVKRFKYVNSHRYYEDGNGMRYGEVIINNPDEGLKDQQWTDVQNGRNFFYEDLMVDYEDNGIRRLKLIKYVN